MGFSLRKPLGNIGKRTGIKIPSIKKIDSNIRAEAKRAGRGEIGKFVGGVGQSVYDVVGAVPRAVVTGQYGREGQKAIGGFLNLASGGTSDYLGRSSGAQKFLNREGTKKWTLGLSENYAGFTHGVSTLNRKGTLSRADSINIYQGAIKVGLAVGTYGAASAYFGATAPAAPAAGGSVPLGATYGPSTAELMAGSSTASAASVPLGTTATAAAAPAAASSIPGYLQTAAGVSVLKALTGGPQAPQMMGPASSDSGLWAATLNNALGRSPAGYAEGPSEAAAGPNMMLIAAAGVAVLFLLKRNGVI